MLRLSSALVLFALPVGAQAGQLVGPIVDASAVIRSNPSFASATQFAGACRDQAGNYWTTGVSSGVTYLFCLSPGPFPVLVSSRSTVSAWPVIDLAYDPNHNTIWVARHVTSSETQASGLEVYGFGDLAFLGSGSHAVGTSSIAWASGHIVLSGQTGYFTGQTSLSWMSEGQSIPACDRGLLHLPASNTYWGGFATSADPAGLTGCVFRELANPSASMPPEVAIADASGLRGGQLAGCEGWTNPSTGEHLGVFCQTTAQGQAFLYTTRMSTPVPSGCGGPAFSKGPSAVQSQLYASAINAAGLTWLVVALAPSNVTSPILAPGCAFLVDPTTPFIFATGLPTLQGQVSANITIPVEPLLQSLPLYLQWVELFSQYFVVGEMRSTAIKQW